MPSVEQLQKLLEAEPDDVFLNFALAMEFTKEGRTIEAIAQFHRVTTLDPKYPAAYFQWGRLLINQDRHAEARDVLIQGLSAAQSAGDLHAKTEMQELIDAIPD
jgi:thioredoxin-like negative regulator of GroEL